MIIMNDHDKYGLFRRTTEVVKSKRDMHQTDSRGKRGCEKKMSRNIMDKNLAILARICTSCLLMGVTDE